MLRIAHEFDTLDLLFRWFLVKTTQMFNLVKAKCRETPTDHTTTAIKTMVKYRRKNICKLI